MASERQGEDRTRTIGAVEKACLIVDTIQELNGARLSEITERLDISKGTVHTHLATLRKGGYIVKNGNTYQLGLRFLDLGEDAKKMAEIYHVGRENLRELAEETDTRAQLVVEELGMAVVLDIARGQHAVAPPTQVGKRDYLHCTAAGKAILAWLPRERVEEILEMHGLKKRTNNTIADRETLFRTIEEIRERGVAFNDEEKIRGLRAVGAPIRGENEKVLGAISVSGPTSGMKGERFSEEIPDKVSNIATTIELNIRIQGSNQTEVGFGNGER